MENLGSMTYESQEGYKKLTGKEIERVVLGNFTHEEFLTLRSLHLDLAEPISEAITKMDESLFVGSAVSREDLRLLLDEEDELFFPTDYKNNMSIVAKRIEDLKKEINRVEELVRSGHAFSSSDQHAENKEALRKNLIVNKVYTTLKDAIRDHYKMKRVIREMITLQENIPPRCAFSKSLIKELRQYLERMGLKITKLTYATTIHENPKNITWPDFFGIDAAVRYEFEKDGKTYSGDFYIDATKDPKKNRTGEVEGPGSMQNKIIVPCQDIDNDRDLVTFGRKTADHISELIKVRIGA